MQVASRLAEAGVKGRSVTLKVKRRKEGAPEPSKFMGHGICDNLSRSLTLSRFVDSASDIAAEAQGLMRALRIPPGDMRGIGITVRLHTRLTTHSEISSTLDRKSVMRGLMGEVDDQDSL